MRKFLVAMLMSMMVMVCGVCSAQITEADLNIGGIYYGQSINEIVEKYGDPVRKVVTPPAGHRFVFLVDDSEVELRIDSKNGQIFEALITGDSLLKTKAGIYLKDSVDDMLNIYGAPDLVINVNKDEYFVYYYTKEKNKDLKFFVSKGLISTISFEEHEEKNW